MDYPKIDIELHGEGASPVGPKFTAGVGREGNKEVFGLYLNDVPTQMRYYTDDLLRKNDTVFDRAKEKASDVFFFDAGGNGRPVYCAIGELRRVMFELGLTDNGVGEYNLRGFLRVLEQQVAKFGEYVNHAVDGGDAYWNDATDLGTWWEAFDSFDAE